MASNKERAPKGGWKSFYGCTSALVGAAAALLPLMASAQTPPEQVEDEEDQIVVTGTRIRNEFNSPSPVQVVTTESATLSGVSSAAEMIQGSSLAQGSFQNDATISSAFVTEGGPGSQTISLRGLGANRTLVLLNGRRAGPAGTRGSVSAFDLNVIPLSLTERVDILKDGASSIYGSDAVAGVVNIITRRDLEGFELNLGGSDPWEEGGTQINGSLIWGHTFDRGHINVALDYDHQRETLNRQRSYTDCGVDRSRSVATGLENPVIDPRTGRAACRGNTSVGLVWLYDFSYEYNLPGGFGPTYMQYDPTGQIGALSPGSNIPPPISGGSPTVPDGWYAVNFDRFSAGLVNSNGAFERNSTFIPDVERTSFYAEGNYELSNSVEAYGEVLLNRRESSTHGFRQIWTYLWSYDYGDPFSAGWGGATLLSPTGTTDHGTAASQSVDYMRAVGGLRGDFAGPLGAIDWDIYIQHSVSDAEYTNEQILADSLYSSNERSDFGTPLFDLFFLGNSLPRGTASCEGLVTPISNKPCVDVNWLSPTFLSGGGFTPEETAFLFDTETGTTKYTQSFVEASVTGDAFTLPAGNVGFAVGAVFRNDEIVDTPGQITQARNAWGASGAGITTGDATTSEVFGEVSVPILRDAPLAESLTATLSGRYTDVSTYGSNETYKLGVNWQITPSFLIRATHGTSFRAPALFELNLKDESGFTGQRNIDPCIRWQEHLDNGSITQTVADNCASIGIPGNYAGQGSSATIISSGGGDLLEAETSTATVVGVVWSPTFADLNIALDYFQIEVNDEVSQLGGFNIVNQCYSAADFPTNPFCSLFNRIGGTGPTQFLIGTVIDQYRNLDSQVNRGIDLTIGYEHELPFGTFGANAQFTYALEDTVEIFDGTAYDQVGWNSSPHLVGNVDFRVDQGNWTYFWGIDYIGESDDADNQFISPTNSTNTTQYDVDAEATIYHSLSVRYRADDWSILGGLANVSDEDPPGVTHGGLSNETTIGPSLLSSQYDYLGRRVFVRLTKTF